MSYAPQPDATLKSMLPWSIGLHAGLLVAIGVATVVHPLGETNWGSGTTGGSSVQVGMVRSLPAIPLPPPDVVSTSRTVDDSKTIYKAEPKPLNVPPPDAIEIPKFEREQAEKYKTRKSRPLQDNTVPPPNAVPGVGPGAPNIPRSMAQTPGAFDVSGATNGGLNMSGVGSGDFGSKYPWFAEAVRNRISSNWILSMIDPSIRTAPRAVITFQILRDGTIANIQIIQSSGVPSVDACAKRAVLSSSPVMRLPNDYYGNSLNVQFYFDFKR